MTGSGFVGTLLSAHSSEMRSMRGSFINMNTQRAGLFGPFPPCSPAPVPPDAPVLPRL